MTKEQEGEEEGQTSPHPGLETLCSSRRGEKCSLHLIYTIMIIIISDSEELLRERFQLRSPTVRSMLCLSPSVRSLYKQPLW